MKQIMLGNEAVARGAYEAGVRVAVAYPGTPSTEITEFIAMYDEIYAQWSANEKVALEVGLGAAIAGSRTLVSMKHVGVNVAADPLFTSAYTGINAGLVIMVADDPGMHSSQNEQDSRYYAKSAHVPMLEPSDSQEAKAFVKLAFEISETYDTPVFVRLTTRISHSQSVVELQERQERLLKPYTKDVKKYVMMPGMARLRHLVVQERMETIASDANAFDINRVAMEDTSIGIITSGLAYQYVKETYPKASVLKLGMVHPLPRRRIESFASSVDRLYVIEELEPIIEDTIKSWGIQVMGKELLTLQGEYSANLLREQLLGETLQRDIPKQLPGRPPVMCPGCPHRGIYHAMNSLGLHATGDIGCYTLGALAPLNGIDTCVDMGASVSMLLGIEKARGKDFIKNWIAIIGDSTFVHSGITGLVDMVYNNSSATVLILDNSTTGMTGHQDNPTTGKTLKGNKAPVLNLVELCKAIGVKNVCVVDPFEQEDVEKVLYEQTQADCLSVIIASRPCELLDKKRPRVAYIVDPMSCIQCELCLEMGCPAISKVNGEIVINDNLCADCGLCLELCRVNAIKKKEDFLL